MRTQALQLLGGVLSLLLAAGCTTTSEGTPNPESGAASSGSEQPPSTSEAPEGGDLPFAGAPDIKKPLDVSRFLTDPCLALTAQQAGQLGVPQTGEQSEELAGTRCTWRNPETHGSTAITWIEKERQGLSGAYQANKLGKLAFFEPLAPIEGYPAVANDITDERDHGTCALAVGVANDLMFDLALQLSTQSIAEKKDPCEVAVVVAGMMLRTMKETS